MGVLQQPYGSLGDLETLGIAGDAIQATALRSRRVALKAASGRLEPYLRKRYAPDFVVALDPDLTDLSAMTLGASLASQVTGYTGRVQDVAIQFPAGGTVGGAGITYQLNLDDYTTGSAYGPAIDLPTAGKIVVQGYTFTLAGSIAAGDVLHVSLRTDPGLSLACAQLAAWILLNNRGIDAETLATLKAAADASIAWAKDLGTGEGELGRAEDSTPTHNEGGIRFTGQHDARAWLRERHG